jgi:AraC family transcriptional regulator of arabinose operon
MPGDVVLYAPREMQDYAGPEEWVTHYFWVAFTPRPHWQKWLHWPQDHHGLRFLHLSEGALREQFNQAIELTCEVWCRPMAASDDLAMNAFEAALIWADIAKTTNTSVPTDLRVVRAIDYLNTHLARPYTPQLLAKHCHMSISRIEHLFAMHMGIPPRRYLEQLRMQRAHYLLEQTQFTIRQVAAAVGYEDPAYFAKRFSQAIGQTPSQLRGFSHPSRRPLSPKICELSSESITPCAS